VSEGHLWKSIYGCVSKGGVPTGVGGAVGPIALSEVSEGRGSEGEGEMREVRESSRTR
jgi:hypothetical protein